MRILVISDLPKFVTGGAETQAAHLIEAWMESGHDVICLGRRMGRGPARIGRHDLTVHRIHVASQFGRWFRGVTFMTSLAWLVLRQRHWADVIYTRFLGEAAITVALLKKLRIIRTPLVSTPANSRGSGDIRFLHSVPFTSTLIHVLDRHCDAINLIAEAMVAESIEAGFSGNNFSRIPNGVPVRAFQPRKQGSPPILLSVGRLSPQKGYDVLLRALARISDNLTRGQVRIAGDGEERDRLIALRCELGLSDYVTFIGELSRQQIMTELEKAELFVLPSYYEGLSNAALEAMERGLPVILTRCGGIDRYIDRQSGWVVPPGDVTMLSRSLSEALATAPASLTTMGANARKIIEENFDLSVVAERYLALFDGLNRRRNSMEPTERP